jgi:hypothetical protein
LRPFRGNAKLLIAAVLMLVAGDSAIADEQVPVAPIPAPPVAQSPAPPSGGTECNNFAKLTAEAQKRRTLVSAAMKAKADRNELCTLMTNFVAAETNVVKFLEDNKVWCGVPEDALKVSKANHEKSMKLRTMACSEEGPRPKAPSLSDAIKAQLIVPPSGDDCWGHYTARMGDVLCTGSRVKLITDPD